MGRQKNYESMRNQIIESIDDYILGVTVLSEDNIEKDKRYTLVIRADINIIRIDNMLLNSSAVANARASEKSMMTFVFVSREQVSIQSYDDKKYSRTDTTSAITGDAQLDAKSEKSGLEGEKIGKSSIQTNDKIEVSETTSVKADAQSTQTITTGGSTTKKSDVVEWNVAGTQEINVVLTGLFSNAGYDVYEAEMIEQETNGMLQTALFKEDYRHGNDLSPKTLSNAAKGVQNLGGKYMAIGTLDIGLRDTDPVSGLLRVYVTVTAKMVDVSGRFPKTVGSVGPVQFSGLGPNQTVARTNALQLAAEKAGSQLVDILNAKSVH